LEEFEMMVNVIYPHQEISRIMTAAVVSLKFRKDLLQNPMNAISQGFGDETFILERDQAEQISKIHATTLEEFATKIVYT
jgi:hypothetical protein